MANLDLFKNYCAFNPLWCISYRYFSWFRGKDLDKDPEFQEKLKDPEFKKYVYGDSTSLLDKKIATI